MKSAPEGRIPPHNAGVGVTVRRVEVGDVDAYRRVRLGALQESPSAFGSTHERESRMTDDEWQRRVAAGAGAHDRATFLAFDGDDVVGVVGIFGDLDPTTPQLVSMWTAPTVRRLGVGRDLVDAALAWARTAGATAVELWVTTGNDPAQRLYESFGFAEIGVTQPHPNDPCASETRMRLVL